MPGEVPSIGQKLDLIYCALQNQLPPGASAFWDSFRGLELSGSDVTSWTDQINGLVMTPPTTAPLLYTEGGYSYLAFDGTGFFMQIDAGLSVNIRSSTVFVVMRCIPRVQTQVLLNLGPADADAYLFDSTRQLQQWSGGGRPTGMYHEDNVAVICGIQSSSGTLVSMNNEESNEIANPVGTVVGGFLAEWSTQPAFPIICFVLGVVVYPEVLTTAKANAVKDFLSRYYRATSRLSDKVLCYSGDSITAGIGVGPVPGDFDQLLLSYPNQAAGLFPDYARRYCNLGVSGYVINAGGVGGAYIGTAATIAFFTRTAACAAWTVCLGVGSNDIEASRTAAQIIADLNTWITAIRAAKPGVVIAVNTIIPRVTFDAAKEAVRLMANTAIKDGTVLSDFAVDFAGIPEITLTTPGIYFDGVHLTALGYSYLAELNASLLIANERI